MWIVIITVTMDFHAQGFFHGNSLHPSHLISASVCLSANLSHSSARWNLVISLSSCPALPPLMYPNMSAEPFFVLFFCLPSSLCSPLRSESVLSVLIHQFFVPVGE